MSRQRLGILVASVAIVAGLSLATPWLLGPDSPLRRRRPARTPAAAPRPTPGPADGSVLCPPGDPATSASFEERPCVLSGRVVGEGGSPLEAEVTVIGLLSAGPRVRAREDGRFRVVLKQPDVVRLAAAADGHATVVGERIEVRPGVQRDLGTLRLGPGLEISGVVVDEAGAPVPGALCSLEADDALEAPGWALQAEGTSRYDRRRTTSAGLFRFDGLPQGGTFRVRARCGARGDPRSVVAEGLEAGRDGVRIVVPSRLVARRYGVHVRVFDPEGRRVPGARVSVVQPFDTVHSGRLASEMDVEAFHPGPTWLLVREAFDEASRPLSLAPKAVRLDPAQTALDVYLAPGEPLRGVASAGGAPVETVLVAEAHLRADGTAAPPSGEAPAGEDWVRLRLGTATDADGAFAFAALPRGRILLRTEPDAPWRVVEPAYVEGGPRDLEVALRPVSRLEGVFEAPEGMRLESVVVRVSRALPGGDLPESSFTACGAGGSISFTRAVAAEGPYALDVRATGTGGESLAPLRLRGLRPGGPPVLARLERGLAAEGVAVLAGGDPAADVLVRALPLGPPLSGPWEGGAHALPLASGRGDGEGRFHVGGLAPGRWRLLAEVRGNSASTDVEVPAEGLRGVRLVLAPNRYLSGRIVDPGGGSTGDLRVEAFDGDGRPAPSPPVLPSADGHFVLGPLPAGRWRVVAGAAEGSDDLRVATSEGAESGVRDLRLPLGPGVRVAGSVQSVDGAPLEGASVVVRSDVLVRHAVTDAAGRFSCVGLPGGSYDVEVTTGDGRRATGRSEGGEMELRPR